MSRPTIQIHDAATGETVVREMTDAEFAQYEADQAAAAEARVAEETARAEREAAHASALAKLAALGLTESEVAAIIP
jgi:hypothetical protein